jgi:signal transduction histidine kinase
VTPLALRARLAIVFASGFALLLVLGGVLLYLQLRRGYVRDFDHGLEDGARAARSILAIDRPEYPTKEAAIAHVVGELIYGDRTIAAFASDGSLLAVSRRIPEHPYFDDVRLSMPREVPTTITLRAGEARVLRATLAEDIDLVLAVDTSPLQHRLAKLRLALFTGLPLILIVGGMFGAWVSALVLRPVVEVARAAEQVGHEVAEGATSFTRVPPHTAGDELTVLTKAINLLIDRLGVALARERRVAEQQRRFLADAAHELRTPVAILRSEAEVALKGGGGDADYREALGRIAAEAEDLGGLLNDLLLVARSDSGALASRSERVYLDDLANAVIGRASKLPQAGGREFRWDDFEAAPVMGDPVLLERALLVLVHNALVHGTGPVQLSSGVRREGGHDWSWLSVRDSGPGIPPPDRERVFERFSRLDRESTGAGLGLSIARAIVEAHGGTLTLTEAAPGAEFLLRLAKA